MLASESNSSPDRVPDSAKMNAVRAASLRSNGNGRVAAACLALAAALALAQEDDAGHFEVRSASTMLVGNVYYLDARVEMRLSADAQAALASGFTLTTRFEIEILNRRPLWMDTEAARLTQLYELRYDALTERYVVRNVNSGDQRSFASPFAALEYLGTLERLPLIDAALLGPGNEYDIRTRMLLDTEQLPGPLRLLAFWRRDWSLGSEWYRWQLASDCRNPPTPR
jgi:hypothetical protein